MTQEQKLTFQCPACRSTLNVPYQMAGVVGPCPHCQNEISAPNPHFQQPAQLAVRQSVGAAVQLPSSGVPGIPGYRGHEQEAQPLPPFPTPEPAPQVYPQVQAAPQPQFQQPTPTDFFEDNDLNLGQALATPQQAEPFPKQQQPTPQQPAPSGFPMPPEQPQAPPQAFQFPEPAAPAPDLASFFGQSQAAPPQMPPQQVPVAQPQPQQEQPYPVAQPVAPAFQQQQQPFPQAQQQAPEQPYPPQQTYPPEQANFPQQTSAPANPFGPSLIPAADLTPAPARKSESKSKSKSSRKKKASDRGLIGMIIKLLALALIAGAAFGAWKFWPELREKVMSKFGGSDDNSSTSQPVTPSGQNPGNGNDTSLLPLGPQNNGSTPTPIPSNIDKKTPIDPPGPSKFPDSNPDMPEVKATLPVDGIPKAKKAEPASLETSNDPNLPKQSEIDAARVVLVEFMNAKTIEERLPLVQAPGKVEKEMREYYARHPYPMQPDQAEFKLANKLQDSDRRFFVFEVTTSQQSLPFPVAIEETAEGLKVDWRSFVEFHDNMLGRFMKVYQTQPERFRVMMERAHYFKEDVPDKGSKLCLRIKPPIPGFEGYAFVQKDSVIGQELDRKFEWDVLYLPILELQWEKTEDGKQFVKILRVVQDNWRAAE